MFIRERISEVMVNTNTIDEVYECLVGVLSGYFLDDNPNKKIGYVAGIVNSEGMEYRERNIARLIQFTDKIAQKDGFPTFSAADVFPEDVFKRVTAKKFEPEEFIVFWRKLFETGLITDVYFTPRWELSMGAKDEYKMAQNEGLKIHFVEESLLGI